MFSASADTGGGRRAFSTTGRAIHHLAEGCLGKLQGFLPCFQGTAKTGFRLNAPIDQDIAELANGHPVSAASLRTHLAGNGKGSFDGQPLAGVTRRIDVGQIMAGHFRPLPLCLQRPVGQGQSSEKS
jgi:hypothetical protein